MKELLNRLLEDNNAAVKYRTQTDILVCLLIAPTRKAGLSANCLKTGMNQTVFGIVIILQRLQCAVYPLLIYRKNK